MGQARIILVDVSESSRQVMVRRLNAQGYIVEAAADPMSAADLALSSPPHAVVADFWMPGISGIQLCRLLRTEPATCEVPVILRGDDDDPRHRFWAERAGAVGYVRKGRMGDLVRMLAKNVLATESDGFFIQLGGGVDIRERIARYLDAALFESVIAAEVRSLSACGSFDRLFDLFAQFFAQVVRYRWLALATHTPGRLALHYHPANAQLAESEARAALGVTRDVESLVFVDEDPCLELEGPAIVTCSVPFGGVELGRLALAPGVTAERDTDQLMALVSRELGGPVRIATLMEEQKLLATIDPLTAIRNRRAFLEHARVEISRSQRYELPLSLILLDVDHFKTINDTRGHTAGDHVLSALGSMLARQLRTPDIPARWGGEEFVIALPNTDREGGLVLAERMRCAVERLELSYAGTPVPVTASFGLATFRPGETLEALINRADEAMYLAKVNGRNRVVGDEVLPGERSTATSPSTPEAPSTPASASASAAPERLLSA